MTAAPETNANAPEDAGQVELTARVISSGGQFLATVDGLELQGSGRTREAAENGLVQAIRGWLERQDTLGRLGHALGVEHLDEEAEIILRFASDEPAVAEEAGG